MAVNIAVAWAAVEDNLPAGLGRERQRAFAGRIVETTEDQAIKGEANLPLCTFHPERIATFFCSAFCAAVSRHCPGGTSSRRTPAVPFKVIEINSCLELAPFKPAPFTVRTV